MKILHINCNYIGTTLHQLMIENLDQYGVKSEVFVPTYDKNISLIKPNNNVYVSECFNRVDRLAFDYKQSKIIKAIEEHYDVASFDLIHAYTLFTDGNAARFLSLKYNIPYVVAVRDTDVNDFFKYMIHLRKIGIEILKSAEAVFFLSQSYKRQVFQRYIPNHFIDQMIRKSFIIPNGIDDFWLENLFCEERNASKKRIDNKMLNVIYVGRVNKRKNIQLTVDALKLLLEAGWKVSFDVIGKMESNSVLKKIRKEDFVHYYPPVCKQELLAFYRNADIFIMPSHTESFGLVYAEAMSQGLPVIYTKGQGFDGQFEDGEIGFPVPDLDKRYLANSIIRCMDDYCEISKRTVKYVHKFKWKSICMEYHKIYSEISGGINEGAL